MENSITNKYPFNLTLSVIENPPKSFVNFSKGNYYHGDRRKYCPFLLSRHEINFRFRIGTVKFNFPHFTTCRTFQLTTSYRTCNLVSRWSLEKFTSFPFTGKRTAYVPLLCTRISFNLCIYILNSLYPLFLVRLFYVEFTEIVCSAFQHF